MAGEPQTKLRDSHCLLCQQGPGLSAPGRVEPVAAFYWELCIRTLREMNVNTVTDAGGVQTQTHFPWRLSSVVGKAPDRVRCRFLGWILAQKSGLILDK